MTQTEHDIRITRYNTTYDADVARLCKLFSEESLNEYGLGVTQDRLDAMTELCKNISFFLVIDGKVVGLIAGMFVNNMTNGQIALQEVIWYVEKEYRFSGLKLMKAFEEEGKLRGAKQIVMALMINSKAEKLCRLYERLGYKPFEMQFLKQV